MRIVFACLNPHPEIASGAQATDYLPENEEEIWAVRTQHEIDADGIPHCDYCDDMPEMTAVKSLPN